MKPKEALTQIANHVKREGYSAEKPVNPARYNEAYFSALNRAAYIAQHRRKGSFILGSEGVIHLTFSNEGYKLTPVVGTYEDRAIALGLAKGNEQQLNDPDFQYHDPFYPDPSYSPRMPGYTIKNPLVRGRNSDNQSELVAEAIKIADRPFRRLLRRGGLVLANTGGVYEIFRTKSSLNGYDIRFVAEMQHLSQLTTNSGVELTTMHLRQLVDQIVSPGRARR